MNFESFAEQHGLIIDHLVYDRWARVPTTDKPNKKNGAYIFDGTTGAVRNWAVHEKPIAFLPNGKARVSMEKIKKSIEDSKAKQKAKNHKAIKVAKDMLDHAVKMHHPYMVKKGFHDFKVPVYNGLMLLPMRIGQNLVGCQTISQNGTKKFLYGQVTKGAELVIDNKGKDIICEGYATAMSLRRVLRSMGLNYKIHVAFSATNVALLASGIPDCLIVADNDVVGINSAKLTGKPFWSSPVVGEDFNDFELRVGTEEAGKLFIASGLMGASD